MDTQKFALIFDAIARRLPTVLGLIVIPWFFAGSPSHANDCLMPGLNANNNLWRALSHLEVTGVFDHPVRLQNGVYQGRPYSPEGHSRPELRLWAELLASGDLDGQPGDEIVGLLSETSGGSGERVYLFAAKPDQDSYAPWLALLVGDRVKVRSLTVSNQKISMAVVEAGSNQPLCCGTEMNHKVWQLQNQQLVLAESQYQGPLSHQSLQGKRWYWLDKPVDKPEVNQPGCVYLAFAGDQIIVQIDSRSVSGDIRESQPGHIQISGFGINDNDLKTSERQLLKNLMSINQYTFRAGQLLLTGLLITQPISLEFAGFDIPQ